LYYYKFLVLFSVPTCLHACLVARIALFMFIIVCFLRTKPTVGWVYRAS
jgi:hypothetical protein